MDNTAPVTRALRIVIGELLLFVAACAAMITTYVTGKTEDPAGIAWVVALAVMALPYGAAVVMALARAHSMNQRVRLPEASDTASSSAARKLPASADPTPRCD